MSDNLALAESIAHLNEWLVPGISRRYQHELVMQGTMTLAGRERRYFTVPYNLDRYELRPVDGHGPTLLTSDCGAGWEICGLVDADVARPIPGAPGTTPDTVLEHETQLRRDLLLGQEPEIDLSIPPVLRVGHGNFAHFLWNNLPAVIQWEGEIARRVRDGALRVEMAESVIDQVHSLGTLEELLPQLAPLTDCSAPWWPAANTLRLGSVRVSDEARARVQASLRKEGDVRPTAPRLWLAVRSPSETRAPENIADLYEAVASRWCLATAGDVVLDGWRHAVLGKSQNPVSDERGRINDVLIGDIHARLADAGLGARVGTTVGMTLRESLSRAGTSSYYVSCPGTIQHKVGWVWNLPGVLVIGPSGNREAQAHWPGHMVENGVLPTVLPSEFVQLEENEGSHDAAPFHIVDVESAARWVVAQALDTIDSRRATH